MKRGTLRRWAELWPIRVSCLFRHLQCCAGPFDDACLTGWLRLLQVIESDVALALGASPGKVKVLSLRAGSVIASVVLRDGVLSDGRSPMDDRSRADALPYTAIRPQAPSTGLIPIRNGLASMTLPMESSRQAERE